MHNIISAEAMSRTIWRKTRLALTAEVFIFSQRRNCITPEYLHNITGNELELRHCSIIKNTCVIEKNVKATEPRLFSHKSDY